jgi:hypothetical protein
MLPCIDGSLSGFVVKQEPCAQVPQRNSRQLTVASTDSAGEANKYRYGTVNSRQLAATSVPCLTECAGNPHNLLRAANRGRSSAHCRKVCRTEL